MSNCIGKFKHLKDSENLVSFALFPAFNYFFIAKIANCNISHAVKLTAKKLLALVPSRKLSVGCNA